MRAATAGASGGGGLAEGAPLRLRTWGQEGRPCAQNSADVLELGGSDEGSLRMQVNIGAKGYVHTCLLSK